MFSLHDFVMKTLREMAEFEPGYRVNRYALTWFDKDVLTARDLEEVDALTSPPEFPETEPELQDAGFRLSKK